MDIHYNSYKMRYEMMDKFLNPIFRSRYVRKLNIFISLDNLYHTMHRPQVEEEIIAMGEKAALRNISNVFNLVAHYKQWGIRHNCVTKVWGIYTSSNIFRNEVYVEGYRDKFKDYMDPKHPKFFYTNEAINKRASFLSIIANYIPNVYMIDSRTIEPSVIPLLIAEDISPANLNILISRDRYDLQYCYKDSWIYLSPKGDNSRFQNRDTLWKYIAEKEKIESDISIYPVELYPTCIAIIGDTFRGIPRLRRIGWKTLFKHLEKIHSMSNDLSNATLDLLIRNEMRNKNVEVETLNNNFAISDIVSQKKNLGEFDIAAIENQIVDVVDSKNLFSLNSLYFDAFPLNIPWLTQDVIEYRK